jgi:hypothetical protein
MLSSAAARSGCRVRRLPLIEDLCRLLVGHRAADDHVLALLTRSGCRQRACGSGSRAVCAVTHDDDRVRVGVRFNPVALLDRRLQERIQGLLPLTKRVDCSSHGALLSSRTFLETLWSVSCSQSATPRATSVSRDLAVEYEVNRKTIRRRLDALELADAERARRTAAKRAEQKRMQRLLGPNYRNPARAPEHQPATPFGATETRSKAPRHHSAQFCLLMARPTRKPAATARLLSWLERFC